MTKYSILTSIVKVEESFERQHIEGVGDKATFKQVSLGWFVTFEGSYESLYFGNSRPSFEVGDKVKITFERMNDAKS